MKSTQKKLKPTDGEGGIGDRKEKQEKRKGKEKEKNTIKLLKASGP